MPAVIANLDFVKERNISAIFRAIVEHGAISRIQIARQCQLAAGSVTRITRFLIEEGFIREVELQSTERGRPAISLKAESDKIQTLSVSVGRTHIHCGLCNLHGELLAEHTEPFTALNQRIYLSQLIELVQSFLKKHRDITQRIAGVGITTPGLVNSKTGVVHYLPHMKVNSMPVAEEVSKAVGLPCYINNFTSAMALAEHQQGVSKHCPNSVMVSVHNGVGSGMILDGKLYEGSALAAGEIGHTQIDPLGKRCYCGNFGCLEMLVSNHAIESSMRKQLQAGAVSHLTESSNINDICRLANNGDQLGIDLLKRAASDLGKVIAMSVNILSPDQIILAGEICQSSEIIHPVIRHCLCSQTVSFMNTPEVKIVDSQLYHKRWLGAYSLVRRALLEQGLLWKMLKNAA
ncbi:hypothetical protein ACH42_09335 [Endozoicomonas sp. (ex Bugula neritina AB1)]|nr:hypothetical protein ACH42_09335 [Endozoicomonas sp. (ex Bugula neritina AB1)]